MKLRDLEFPASDADFLRWQEEAVGRALSAGEREAIVTWLPLFNEAYDFGLQHDKKALKTMLGSLDKTISEDPDTSPTVCTFLHGCCAWMVYAWQLGHEKSAAGR